jgi:hypothetical protein
LELDRVERLAVGGDEREGVRHAPSSSPVRRLGTDGESERTPRAAGNVRTRADRDTHPDLDGYLVAAKKGVAAAIARDENPR